MEAEHYCRMYVETLLTLEVKLNHEQAMKEEGGTTC
jgi:hypothetical protein